MKFHILLDTTIQVNKMTKKIGIKMTKPKKQFFLYKPKTIEGLYFASIVLLIFSFFVLGTTLLIKVSDNNNSVNVSTQEPFKVGEQITTGQVSITVTSVDYGGGSEPFIAPEGMQYAVVRLNISNRDIKPISIAPTIDTYIKADDGKVSYVSPYALKDPFRAGELLPGESIQGDLSYLVKKDVSLKYFVDSIWSGSSIPIKIN